MCFVYFLYLYTKKKLFSFSFQKQSQPKTPVSRPDAFAGPAAGFFNGVRLRRRAQRVLLRRRQTWNRPGLRTHLRISSRQISFFGNFFLEVLL